MPTWSPSNKPVNAPTSYAVRSRWARSSSPDGRRAPRKGEGIGTRITQTHWFVREHDEVPAETWKLLAVKSKANCGACHTRAEQGDFSEGSLRVPK